MKYVNITDLREIIKKIRESGGDPCTLDVVIAAAEDRADVKENSSDKK